MRDPLVLREECKHLVAALEAALTSALPNHDANTLIREAFATLLLLRWLSVAEAEQEAMAVFEERPYHPSLPTALQWPHLVQIDQPSDWAGFVSALVAHLERADPHCLNAAMAWLPRLAGPLRRLVRVHAVHVFDLIRWLDALPLDTPGERRTALELFDAVLAETSEAYDGQYQTPANIARLVAALAQPQPGERVYDPCFGSGNFLISAWREAERSRRTTQRPGALLDVAGVEINESAFLLGLTRLVLAGIEHPLLELGNSLEREAPSSLRQQGFDLVLANPPIGAKLPRDAGGHQHFAFPTSDSAGLFIQHALTQLKPQGRAVIVVPEGFLFRGGAERDLRRHLLERGQVEAVVGLPAGAFAPYTGVKGALLLLRRQGGAERVRMVAAASQFEASGRRKAPVIRAELARQLAQEVRRPELRTPSELPPGVPEGTPSSDGLARSVWEVKLDDLAATDWDLTPRRREEGGLDELLASLNEGAPGEQGLVLPLKDVAQVMAGRAVKSADLVDEPTELEERAPATPYLRIKDLNQGKVGRPSRWVRAELAAVERRWALLPGDVLVSKSGTIGKAAVVRNGAVGAIAGNGLYVLRPNHERLDPAFLVAYLASPNCQNWLAARSRGAVIQHLNRVVLDELPVPLPPLGLQARAAAQFREHGTDALNFLIQASASGEAERLATWLADFSNKLPVLAAGLDAPPPLRAMESLVAMAATPRRWLAQEDVSSDSARWLRPLVDTLEPLSGLAQIPPGPGLLSVLQDAERGVRVMLERASGHLPVEAQARAVAERLHAWLRELIDDLAGSAELRVTQAPPTLSTGSAAEFTLMLANAGALPLRAVQVTSEPDWGLIDSPYLAESGTLALTLRGDAPKQGERLALKLHWQARTLIGNNVSGSIEVMIQLVQAPPQAAEVSHVELGGSPYVTGSPLEPQHGHAVFYGRERLLEQLARQIITHGNVVLLEGNRRAGKTSILKHLEGRTAIPDWLAVYASLQGAEGASQAVGVPTAEVFRHIAFELAKGVATLGVETPLPDGSTVEGLTLFGANTLERLKESKRCRKACRSGIAEDSSFADFRDYLEVLLLVVESQGLGIVLMLDEFDKLQEGIDNGVTSPQVPENIRFLIQSYPKFSAILTGSRRLKRLREEYWSALYGLGTTIPVTALDVDSARRIVTEPVRDLLVFSDEAVDRVIETTARQPYLIQCLCNRIFDFASQTKTRSITLSVVEHAAAVLVRDNEHFATLWDFAARGPAMGGCRRQFILSLCALNFKRGNSISFGTLREQLVQVGVEADDAALDVDLAYLRELDLIELSGEIFDGHYRLAIPLMAQWIEQQHDADVVASRARIESEEEHA
ncbi:N-6 DNA methylase [Cupriavidus lacunae]|uniref:N-6 DNA methylase n=1 Tax=Cupriavidus lacunae TaxID=2666307 RepID=UPI001058DC00|nr:N-6 DNA methylase [Cupriavidus lacunae]